MNEAEDVAVGIDVAKATLDVAIRPSGEERQAANDPAGIAVVVAWLQSVQPSVIVVEATGGYEAPVVAELGVAGLRVVVVNPRQVRDFAKATGRLAKTDRLDAQALAHFGQAVRPTPRPLRDEEAQALAALVEAPASGRGDAHGGSESSGGNACSAGAHAHPGASGMVGHRTRAGGRGAAPAAASQSALARAGRSAAQRPRHWPHPLADAAGRFARAWSPVACPDRCAGRGARSTVQRHTAWPTAIGWAAAFVPCSTWGRCGPHAATPPPPWQRAKRRK